MAQYLEIILPEQSLDNNKVSLLPEHAVCVCCLGKTKRFVNLATCKHKEFLETFNDFKSIFFSSVICHLCHNTLKNIEEFRHQVEQTILMLKEQVCHLQTPKSYNLATCVLDNMTITPNIIENIETEVHEQNYEYVIAAADVKVETDATDMDTYIPVSGIEMQKEATVKYNIAQKVKSSFIKRENTDDSIADKQNTGKLEMLFLTREELQTERELLRADGNYSMSPFKCDKCIIAFDKEIYLEKHCKKRHDERIGKYVCGVCETVFVSKMNLSLHYRSHFTRYECKTCSKRYIDERLAVLHYNEKHRMRFVRDKYTCRIADCGFVTQEVKQLRAHAQAAHRGGARAPYCAACRMHFRTSVILQHHLKHHSNHVTDSDKKYMCDECGARFITKTKLKGHIEWVHLRRSKYQCPQCLKILRSSRNLQRHIDFVHDKKELPRDKMCDYCGKGFTYSRCLQAHIRTHTGERPYQCGQCSATFTHSATLYNHTRLVHKPLLGVTKRIKRKIK